MITKLLKKKKTKKRTKNKFTKKLSIGIFILLLIILFIVLNLFPVEKLSKNNNIVKRVIDGDTFVLQNEEIVRLICIDTPELGENNSQEAKEFLENLILNREVRLEKDTNDRDKYGRLLRYVYVNISNKEIFVNKELVKNNYAKIYRYEPDTKRCNEIEN